MSMTEPDFATAWDRLTIDELRARGSVKWTVEPGTIGAWVAEMDFGTAPAVLDAWRESAELLEFGYPPHSLAREMSEATAAWYLSEFHWAVAPDDIAPIADVIKGLELAILEFSAPGAPVIVPTPAYMPFLFVPPTLGREVIQVPMQEEQGRLTFDLDAMRVALEAGANLIILANPGNPVGRVYSPAELIALADLADAYGARVFSDEIHAPLTLFGTRHVPLASVSEAGARVSITATSASKAWNLPGLKCAQLILSNDADREKWRVIGPMASHGASTPGIRANTAAYTSGGSWLGHVRDYLEGNFGELQRELAEHLPLARVAPLEGTYLTWLDLSAYPVDGELGALLLEHAKVQIVDGPAFGEGFAGRIRLNIAMPRPLLREVVRRVAAAVRS